MDRTKNYHFLIGALAFTVVLAGLLTTGCKKGPSIVVGSKNFSEQLILGEIIAQHLEKTMHATVIRKLDLGGTLLAHQAIVKGEIDVYPEYTGTALTAILKDPPDSDPAKVLSTVREGYKQWGLQWLPPLGFNNTFAMVIRKEDAVQRSVKSISEAAAWGQWKLGSGYEFIKRPDGLGGLIQTYRLNCKGSVKTMDLGLLYQALEEEQVDMVAGSSTDGLLSAKPFVVLEDDQHYFPPYEAAIVVRSAAIEKYPGLKESLSQLSGRIDTAKMRAMNYELDGKHRPVKEIAAEFLK
jgi:glycine betaine/choline ABC-type transport system substrate-binding protein